MIPSSNLKCLICGHEEPNALHWHLRKHHLMKTKDYYSRFSVGPEAVYAPSYRAGLGRAGVKGGSSKNNPFRGHGGKFSPFSKSFVKYAGDEKLALAAIHNVHQKRDLAGNNSTQLSYWLKRTSTRAEAEAKLNDRQRTFSLDKLIKKYGEEEGRRRWKDRQNRWQATLNFKTEEEIERINNSKIFKSGVSQQSIKLFSSLYAPKARWSRSGGEKCIKVTLDGVAKRKMVDFMFNDKIIEYFGTYWHADPRVYADDIIVTRRVGKITAKALRAQDEHYISQLSALGYQVLVVWEKDFTDDPQKVILECQRFLEA